MKIDEAIEILTDEPETLDWENESKAIEALKLGVEALNRVKGMRISPCTTADEILPGETV